MTRVAVVTGGASGIGLGICRQLATDGHHVAVLDRQGISLTKALAVELARHGITANAIAPSLVDTPMARAAEVAGKFPGVDVVGPMVPVGRAGTPMDIAAACSFLCSEGGSYVTGQVLGVNGGMYI